MATATTRQRQAATLSQRWRPKLPQLSFSTVSQCCDNVNHDVVTTLSQRCCVISDGVFLKFSSITLDIMAFKKLLNEHVSRKTKLHHVRITQSC